MKKTTPSLPIDSLVDGLMPKLDPAQNEPSLGIPRKKVTGPRLAKAANKAMEAAVTKAKRYNRSLASSPAARADAFKNFEEAVGGRTELVDVLKHCPPDTPAFKALKRLFEDVDFNATQDVTLSLLCRKHKVNLAQIMIAFRDATAVKLNVEAVHRLGKYLHPVLDDVAQDAQNSLQTCPVCLGSKRIPRVTDAGEYQIDDDGEIVTQLCYNCKNTPGKVFERHDPQSRKLFFQLTGLLKPEGKDRDLQPINIANISGNFTPGDGSYEYLIKAIDRVSIPSHTQSLDDEIIEVPYALYDDAIPGTVPSQGPEASQNPSADPA